MDVYKQITANNIELNEYPFLRELAMEAYLMENSGILKLDDNNFSEANILGAEIHFTQTSKSINNNGRIDILANYGKDYLAMIELKYEEINAETLRQLNDYLDAKENLINELLLFGIVRIQM